MGRAWVPEPKKLKTLPSAGKVMATVFWDAKGVIILDFLPKRSKITGVYYANLLDQLRTAICEKCWGKLSKGVLLQQDNARVHTCKVAMDAVEQNEYELIPHPVYSPDLETSSYPQIWIKISMDVISSLTKKSRRQLRSGGNGKDHDFFSSGLMTLERCWSKCITLKGNYIEKDEVDLNRK